ncbi:hypothetical protein BY458DRAFT_510564 [Sporodiniella umbellata]|nr:hypothetical protein BY458DRAFT_510564 [Sporodiniella umbellata]
MDRVLAFEILTQIMSHLKDDQSALLELAKSSSTLYKPALPFLYYAPQFDKWKQFELFAQQLTPHNGLYVRYMDLSSLPYRWDPSINNILPQLASKLPHLNTLNLELCRKLTNKRLIESIKSLPELRFLYVENCKLIDDQSVKAILSYCPLLEEIQLGATGITDSSLFLLSQMHHLTQLEIPNCEKITESGVRYILDKSPALKHFDIRDCYNVVGEFGDPRIIEASEYSSSEDELNE